MSMPERIWVYDFGDTRFMPNNIRFHDVHGGNEYIRADVAESEKQAALEAARPKWTTGLPTEPGWYWFDHPDWNEDPQIDKLRPIDIERKEFLYYAIPILFEDVTRWCKIEVPK